MSEKTISFKNSKDVNLTASLWAAESESVVILAHGSGSNRYANGRFKGLAQALQQNGYDVLSFDFSGHGQSDDYVFDTATSVEDVKAVIAYAKSQGYKKIALFGHSFGALSCFKALSSSIDTMISLGGVSGPVEWPWKPSYNPEQLEKIYQDGYITAPINDGLREVVKCSISVFDDIKAIDQIQLFKAITFPVFFIHGDADSEEQKLTKFSEQALPLLSRGSEVKIISGANHNFFDHMPEVISATTSWLEKHMPINKS